MLPADHPRRAELREDFLAACARHHAIRQELAPLVAAWRTAGVDAMLFKGFHLAELIYPVAGARFHGDVDILIRPTDEQRAIGVARDLGWADEQRDEQRAVHAHDVCGLYGPGAAMVDLHRFPLHGYITWSSTRRRITEAIWQRSREVAWAGTIVRVPDPVDALLILVLQRSWGIERWHLKPHDVLDVRALTERGGVTREALRERAGELGCSRTLELFLMRCDPAAGRLDLVPPSTWRVRRWDLTVLTERRTPGMGVERQLVRLSRAPSALADVAAALPTLFRVRRALRRHIDLRQLLASLTPAPPAHVQHDLAARARAVRGVRWGTRLLRLRAGGPCVVRSLALYVALRRLGWPVVFVSGVQRDAQGIVGHAWVELDGRVLPELDEPFNREWFQVGFQYPDADSP